MLRLLRTQAVRNVFASWVGLGTTMLTGFLLTPFILHRLGDAAFGLWVLLTAFTGYYGLLDLGVRNSVVRYVARHFATSDWEEVSRVVSTSFYAYTVSALALIAVTGFATWQVDKLFVISAEWKLAARQLLVVVGAGAALGMPLGLFGGVLEGLQRFAWVGMVQTVATLVRAGLIVLALKGGAGIVSIGLITIIVNLISSAVYVLVVFRLCPQLRLRLSLASLSMLRTLGTFGLVTFWIAIAQVLRFQFHSMVIAAFLSLQAVTLFSVSSRLVTYATEIVQVMAQIFTPMSSALDVSGDQQGLRRVFIISNRYSAFLILPMGAVLLLAGRSILRVWVGPAYASSYNILAILTVPMALYLAQAGSPKILYGMARHRVLAVVLIAEGVLNLGLSCLLVRPLGIEGVAIGTAVPLAATSILFLPPHLCKLLGIRIRDFVSQAYFYPVMCTAPLCLVLWALDRWLQPQTWTILLAELALGGTVYGLALMGYFYLVELRDGNNGGYGRRGA